MDVKLAFLLKNAQQKPVLSRFLTVDEQRELLKADVGVFFSDSYPREERKRAFLFPYENPSDLDFKIAFLKIVSKTRLRHPDILGAILGLGISREVIGDIILADDAAYVIVAAEIEKFIRENLLQIGKSRCSVEVSDKIPDQIFDNYCTEEIIVNSLRLDGIVAKAIGLSRTKAQELISLRNAKINGTVCTDNDYLCQEEDIISLLKFGRIIVRKIARKTKKDKLVLVIDRTK